MGLEQDDPVVRRRLSQKLQFIIDSGAPAAPTDAELQAFLDEHPDRYRLPPSYALRQAYFDPSKHSDGVEAAIDAARRALAGGAAAAGDATMLPARLEGDAADVARQFGDDFERAVRALPVGSWQGPVRSGFGLHLVLVERRDDGRAATLADVRAEVARDLMNARAEAAQDAFYERLRSKYVVRIEAAQPASGPAG
jgi:parvulin-like peptidyl-prolyl isomerase